MVAMVTEVRFWICWWIRCDIWKKDSSQRLLQSFFLGALLYRESKFLFFEEHYCSQNADKKRRGTSIWCRWWAKFICHYFYQLKHFALQGHIVGKGSKNEQYSCHCSSSKRWLGQGQWEGGHRVKGKSSQDRESIRSEVSEEKEHMDNKLLYT